MTATDDTGTVATIMVRLYASTVCRTPAASRTSDQPGHEWQPHNMEHAVLSRRNCSWAWCSDEKSLCCKHQAWPMVWWQSSWGGQRRCFMPQGAARSGLWRSCGCACNVIVTGARSLHSPMHGTNYDYS